MAPLAVKVAACVGQTEAEVTVTVGLGTTVIVPTAEAVQVEEVPVTVYEVVAPGEAVIVEVAAPVLHE